MNAALEWLPLGAIVAVSVAFNLRDLRARRKRAKPPAQGARPHPEPGPRPVPGRPNPPSAPAPATTALGPCDVTIHHHRRGVVILNHTQGRRITILGPHVLPDDDEAFLARIAREMRQQ